MKISALLCLLPSLALAGLPTPEEEIAALKAEYAKREAVAVRPVKDWLADELAKKEKAFLAAGKSEAAAAVAKDRAIMLLCSTPWMWNVDKVGDRVLEFRMDGSATRADQKSGASITMRWSIENWTVTLIHNDGRKASITIDPAQLTFKGHGFSPEGESNGKAIAKGLTAR